MHSLSFLSAVHSTINLCTGPFFLKVISPNTIQCLFSSTIALPVFQSLKQNEDKSKDLGKRRKKVYYIRFRKATRGREHKGPGFVSKEATQRRTKQKADQDVQAVGWGFYYYENTWISCPPYGSSAFPRTLPFGRLEILLFASEAGREWSCMLSSKGMVWCRAGNTVQLLKVLAWSKPPSPKRDPHFTHGKNWDS